MGSKFLRVPWKTRIRIGVSPSLGSAGATYPLPCDSDVELCDVAPTDNVPRTEGHALAGASAVS